MTVKWCIGKKKTNQNPAIIWTINGNEWDTGVTAAKSIKSLGQCIVAVKRAKWVLRSSKQRDREQSTLLHCSMDLCTHTSSISCSFCSPLSENDWEKSHKGNQHTEPVKGEIRLWFFRLAINDCGVSKTMSPQKGRYYRASNKLATGKLK